MSERLTLCILSIILVVMLAWPGSASWMARVLRGGSQPARNASAVEIEALEAKLSVLEGVENELPSWNPDLKPALIYSRYPFNFRNQLWVNAGSNDGIAAGALALIPSATGTRQFALLGKVARIWTSGAVVQTLFDPQYQLAVRVGQKGTEALLTGGSEPKLTLIPKNADIRNGDIVYAVDPQVPYGLAIGRVDSVRTEDTQVFTEATLRFAYGINDLRTIWLANP